METACENLKAAPFPLVIVCGLSGAGKSTALGVFEDLRFFTVDGIPPSLAPKLAGLFAGETRRQFRGLALGVDVRNVELKKGVADAWMTGMEEMKGLGASPQVLFLEARTAVLMRRYAATRRPHPMLQLLCGGEESCSVGLEKAINLEADALLPLRGMADLVVDTSDHSVHDLRRVIKEKWGALDQNGKGLTIHLITFGFKYGPPSEADLVFDLRFLPNPYFVEELRPLTGKDPAIVDYVLGEDPGKTFLQRLREFLLYLMPLYDTEGRYRITIAIGCTGGRHRSVAVTEALHTTLKAAGYPVSMEHRHIALG
ncbi:MAG: RNase adapter RapZ [Desulfovibrio sp.]|nr:RNase adapter RapZ [Desulfovibrio sp.]